MAARVFAHVEAGVAPDAREFIFRAVTPFPDAATSRPGKGAPGGWLLRVAGRPAGSESEEGNPNPLTRSPVQWSTACTR